MTISVIIATFNRADLLAECLRHLANQEYGTGDEVVIVDNGSTDRTAQVVQDARGRFPVPVRYLSEATPGKSIAVGRALQVATGNILAFIDDDVTVDRGWLTAIRTAMADERLGAIGGPVAPRWERTAPPWLQLDYERDGRMAAPLALLDYGSVRAPLGHRTLLGANLAVRRDVISRVGGFAPHLGKIRGTLRSGEDHELCRRIQDAGFLAVYDPTVLVHHFVPAHRMRVRYFLGWFFWSGITHAAIEERERPKRVLFGLPLFLIRRSVAGVFGALAAAVTGRRGQAVRRAIDVAFAAGYAAKTWRMVGVDPRPTAG